MSASKLEEIQKRVDAIVEQYMQLQQQVQQQKTAMINPPTSSNEEITAYKQQIQDKDTKIADLTKQNEKLEYRIEFLVRELKQASKIQ